MEEKILQQFGLTGNETKIYIALLEYGPCLVSKIVKETKLNRTHIYDRLNQLIEKGLVTYVIKTGKKYFNAISPDRLLQILEEKELDINKQRKELKRILPQLLKKKSEEDFVEVFKGKEGLKSLLNDILKEKQEVFILGFTGSVAKELEFFYSHFQKKRAKLGIKKKIIADYKLKNNKLIKQPLTTIKYLPKEYQSPSGMWIYKDKTVIFLPDELTMILIKSEKIAKQYKNYFNLMWKLAKK